eukprot:TRINITY_DN9030_c0_g1_i3.p1 TRINITY_DN9030_c0_g1~~TRINITY_DN9030_c0_g1_i3.p1  ORF type:complete len:312 (-),score=25.90 TRINITY_DN9030_c0_g1_i3:75-872(-)
MPIPSGSRFFYTNPTSDVVIHGNQHLQGLQHSPSYGDGDVGFVVQSKGRESIVNTKEWLGLLSKEGNADLFLAKSRTSPHNAEDPLSNIIMVARSKTPATTLTGDEKGIIWSKTKSDGKTLNLYSSQKDKVKSYDIWRDYQLGHILVTLTGVIHRTRDYALKSNMSHLSILDEAEQTLSVELTEKAIKRLPVSDRLPSQCIKQPEGRVAAKLLQAAYYTYDFFNKSSPADSLLVPNREATLQVIQDAIIVATNYIIRTSHPDTSA